MYYIKALTLNKKLILTVAQFATLLAVAIIAPLFHFQPITGPIVNATLFVGTVLLGIQNAILLALIPSLIALSVGLLPAVLAPAVPFIMFSNVILILTFYYLKKRNFWLSIISASFLKFLFLFSTSSVVISLLLKKEAAQKVASMLSYPQLLTALAGGVIAYFVLKIVKK